METRHIYVPNGSVMVKEAFYSCDRCGVEIHESEPMHRNAANDYCPECAYLLDQITAEEFKKSLHYLPDSINVGKHGGKVHVWMGKKAPWDRTNRDYRATQQYKEWRLAVFTRDSFTCQKCGTVRTKIEAHHIKTFNKHPKLRFEVSNGTTLCRPCHINEHRGRKNGAA